MKSLSLLPFLCALSLLSFATASTAYPSIPGTNSGEYTLAGDEIINLPPPPRREVYDNGRIFDISHKYVKCQCSVLTLTLLAIFDVDALDLERLIHLALLVDAPRDNNITAEVMKSLDIPKGVCPSCALQNIKY
ncbi:hypothetical protein TanjilG_18365 [Lupinus angustifolius]|uniref:Uncharacterized protein n=1 Tax=Lupinus angustifolius TaxID=3871 RepID=A0A1J7HX19_LUPAN|nr:hypothetical protein TanjilG_18365 [Lupinus angustifolius]